MKSTDGSGRMKVDNSGGMCKYLSPYTRSVYWNRNLELPFCYSEQESLLVLYYHSPYSIGSDPTTGHAKKKKNS